MNGKSIIRKLSILLSISAGFLLISKLAFGNPAEPQEDEQ
jgi:hypothetical protein